jgi:hypothetical protein
VTSTVKDEVIFFERTEFRIVERVITLQKLKKIKAETKVSIFIPL